MTTAGNKPLKLLYLAQILWEETDDEHGITMKEIQTLLQEKGIKVDRKTLYNDIALLKQFGMDILMEQMDRTFYYSLLTRPFELSELKILVDIAQSARFLTSAKTELLIKKLDSLTSKRYATELHRHVNMAGRVKALNEEIYYNVDKLYFAIDNNYKISFLYRQWNPDKTRTNRHNGKIYVISPGHLIWDNENYYLLGYDADAKKTKHFRVDKMHSIMVILEPREGLALMNDIDIASYDKRIFGMFDGEVMKVTLNCPNELANPIVDKFGTHIVTWPLLNNRFLVCVEVIISKQFFGWLFGLGSDVQIVSPPEVINAYSEMLNETIANYQT